MKIPITCRVVRVDEKTTTCQTRGNTFPVDEHLKGKLCGRAQALVEAAALKLQTETPSNPNFILPSMDVPCPDNHVIYRLFADAGDTDTFHAGLEHAATSPDPRITAFLPDRDRRNGMSLIIFPGGGYGGLAKHEGKGYAEHFCGKGVACFVVQYRLGSQGHRHPAMLEDAQSAIATIRQRAPALGLNPRRIGVIGSSAGGHLAAHSMVGYTGYHDPALVRPDFGVLCYPVTTMQGPYAHAGSRNNLLGPDPSPEQIAEVSCDQKVTPDTPPCFIWHTAEDAGVPVEHSLLFASALRRHKVPFELHVYQKGPHGLGLNTTLPWADDCLRWMNDLWSPKGTAKKFYETSEDGESVNENGDESGSRVESIQIVHHSRRRSRPPKRIGKWREKAEGWLTHCKDKC
jgi:acetyl esterase/lipase